MSAERTELLRELRSLLVDLSDEGLDFAPLPAALEPAAAEPPAPPAAASPAPSGNQLAGATPDSAPGERGAALEALRTELAECTRCGLCEQRQTVVFGEGNPNARVVFVGEGPGAQEDRSGRPFVGRAGELLTKMIEALGWTRDDVYICNIVKCRPPGNRDPKLDEIATCRPFLDRQLAILQPAVIVTLGKPASSTLLGRNVAITRTRGIWQEWNGVPVMPTYHPAFLLRQYTRENRQAVWNDLQAVRSRVEGEVPA